MEAKELKKGSYIMFNNEPHQVTRKEVVVFGTHSHSKLKVYLRPFTGGGEKTAREAGIDFLGKVPFDQNVVSCGDSGESLIDKHSGSPVAMAFDSIADKMARLVSK